MTTTTTIRAQLTKRGYPTQDLTIHQRPGLRVHPPKRATAYTKPTAQATDIIINPQSNQLTINSTRLQLEGDLNLFTAHEIIDLITKTFQHV